MPILPGGDILPAFMAVGSIKPHHDGLSFDNTRLRVGEVTTIVYPDDKESRSKKFVEYHVLVQQRSNRTGNAKLYRNCLLMNPFAGLADRASFTLRADNAQNLTKSGLGKGSKVMVLCANGETNNAYIIGGCRDQTDETDKKVKDLKHHLYFNFNGVSFFIDDDGQLFVTYNGKTGIDGKTDSNVDSNAPGSTLKFGKDGAIQIADKDAKNAVTIDHANKKVTIARDQAFELGDATDHMLLGESFRNAQQQLNNNLMGKLQALQGQLQAAGTALNAAVTPAPGAPLGLNGVGAALLAAAQTVNQMAQAIQQFEQSASQKNSFLSQKNKAD